MISRDSLESQEDIFVQKTKNDFRFNENWLLWRCSLTKPCVVYSKMTCFPALGTAIFHLFPQIMVLGIRFPVATLHSIKCLAFICRSFVGFQPQSVTISETYSFMCISLEKLFHVGLFVLLKLKQ